MSLVRAGLFLFGIQGADGTCLDSELSVTDIYVHHSILANAQQLRTEVGSRIGNYPKTMLQNGDVS